MKWFQHQTHSHTDIALRDIITEFGLEGYGFYFICLELVGQQGSNYRLNGAKSWKNALKNISGIDDKKMLNLLKKFSEVNLICSKSLSKDELYIPKMKKYSDDYTKKQRRVSEQTSDNIPLDKTRLDKIILEYIKAQGWEEKNKNNPLLLKDIYRRNCKPAKQLILIADNDELAISCIQKMATTYAQKGLNWTLETVIKHFSELKKPQVRYE